VVPRLADRRSLAPFAPRELLKFHSAACPPTGSSATATAPVLMETFVQAPRFRGTCYKAANWVHVSQTTGRGKLDVTHQHALPVKDAGLYPLERSFHQLLVG
jgi:hypothetical protein